MALTPKQQRFVDEYLVDLNATQAAIRAGYTKKSAGAVGHENLTKPEIEQAVKIAMSERAKQTQIDAEWVLKEAADLYQVCRNADDRSNAARTLELVGKHTDVNAWRERVELTGKDGGPIELSETERRTRLASILAAARKRGQEKRDA